MAASPTTSSAPCVLGVGVHSLTILVTGSGEPSAASAGLRPERSDPPTSYTFNAADPRPIRREGPSSSCSRIAGPLFVATRSAMASSPASKAATIAGASASGSGHAAASYARCDRRSSTVETSDRLSIGPQRRAAWLDRGRDSWVGSL